MTFDNVDRTTTAYLTAEQVAAGRVKQAESQLQALYEARDDAKQQAATRSGPNSQKQVLAFNAAVNAQAQYQQISAVLNRPLDRRDVNHALYAATAFILAGLEAPVNKFIFDIALRSYDIVSWAVSFLVGLILFGLSHVTGVTLRQVYSERERRLYKRKLLLVVLLLMFLCGVVALLSVARWRYTLSGGTTTNLGQLFRGVGSDIQSVMDLITVLQLAFSDQSAQILGMVNATAIGLAIALAYIAHDPDKDFDNAANEKISAERAVEILAKSYTRELEAIDRRFGPEIARWERDRAAALGQLAMMNTNKPIRLLPHDGDNA